MTTMMRLIGIFRPYWGWLALSTLLSLAAIAAGVGLLAVAGWFIAAMGLAGMAGTAINYFTPSAAIRALAIVRMTARYGERIVGHEVTLRMLAHSRQWLYERLEPLAPLGLGMLRSGDMLVRMRGDIDRLEAAFLRIVSPATVAAMMAIAVVLVLASYVPLLAIAEAVLLAAAGIALPVFAARSSRAAGEQITEQSSALSVMLVDMLDGLTDLSAAGAAPAQARRIEALSDAIIADETRLAGLAALSQAGVSLAAGLALAAAIALASPAVATGRIAAPDLAMLTLLAFSAFEAIAAVPLAAQSLAAMLASARRLFALADAQAPVAEPQRPRPGPAESRLVFNNVSLIYPGARRKALSSLDLEIAPGRRIAIVGHSGSGKSSVIALALRFAEPTAGCITLGGIDVRQLCGDDVRARVAVAEQKPHLFAMTIEDNLRLARPDASRAEIEAACHIAQLHDFISAQPQGYLTFVGSNGLQLSGGETRRLAVARALLKRAPLLLLDEPAEGLDAATARTMLDAIMDAHRECGLMVVSHHPTLLADMDEVIVLDDGSVVARGRPSSMHADKDYAVAKHSAIDGDSLPDRGPS